MAYQSLTNEPVNVAAAGLGSVSIFNQQVGNTLNRNVLAGSSLGVIPSSNGGEDSKGDIPLKLATEAHMEEARKNPPTNVNDYTRWTKLYWTNGFFVQYGHRGDTIGRIYPSTDKIAPSDQLRLEAEHIFAAKHDGSQETFPTKPSPGITSIVGTNLKWGGNIIKNYPLIVKDFDLNETSIKKMIHLLYLYYSSSFFNPYEGAFKAMSAEQILDSLNATYNDSTYIQFYRLVSSNMLKEAGSEYSGGTYLHFTYETSLDHTAKPYDSPVVPGYKFLLVEKGPLFNIKEIPAVTLAALNRQAINVLVYLFYLRDFRWNTIYTNNYTIYKNKQANRYYRNFPVYTSYALGYGLDIIKKLLLLFETKVKSDDFTALMASPAINHYKYPMLKVLDIFNAKFPSLLDLEDKWREKVFTLITTKNPKTYANSPFSKGNFNAPQNAPLVENFNKSTYPSFEENPNYYLYPLGIGASILGVLGVGYYLYTRKEQ